MFTDFRRKLRRISYYSRSRERSIWTRAIDLALPVTLVLALPAALFVEGLIERARTAEEASGVLIGDPNVKVRAPILPKDRRWDYEDGVPYGEWTLLRFVVVRGWPLASQKGGAPAKLDLNIYDEPSLRQNVQLGPDAPERVAIERSLLRAGRVELRDGWTDPEAGEPERRWLHSGLNVAAWWVFLFVTTAIVLRVLSLFALLLRARRAVKTRDLARVGLCTGCRYDLRGLEFNERCPECGTLVE